MTSTRPRKATILAVILGLLAALIALAAPQASAKVCVASPGTGHCYGTAEWPVTAPSGFLGIDAKVRTNCMSINVPSADFVTNEIWYDTNAAGTDWVEAGIILGLTPAGEYTTPHLFWAEQVGGVFTDHIGGAYTLGTYQDFKITKTAGSSTVSVYRNGSLSGQSTGQPTGNSIEIVAGTETTTNSVLSYGSVSDMTYENLTGGWVSGWTGANLFSDNPPWITGWATSPSWMTSRAGPIC